MTSGTISARPTLQALLPIRTIMAVVIGPLAGLGSWPHRITIRPGPFWNHAGAVREDHGQCCYGRSKHTNSK
jgi:hypothetical protein